MRQLQSARIQGANDSQRLSDNNISRIFTADLRLEAIGNPTVMQTFDALWQRSVKDDIEGKLVIVRTQNLRFTFAGVTECPGFLEEHLLLHRPATCPAAGGQMPAEDDCQSVDLRYFARKLGPTYETRDIPVK